MDFTKTMIDDSIKTIDSMVRTGTDLQTAINQTKAASAAGPRVWDAVEQHYLYQIALATGPALMARLRK